jgi:hypothetical protein
VTVGTRKTARTTTTEGIDMSVSTNIRRVIARDVAIRVVSALVTVGLTSLGACRVQPLTIPGKARDPREMPGSTANRGANDVEPAVASKRVAAKEAPLTLIAEDGARCTVTESKFNNTRVGDTVFCAWRTSDRAP